MPRNNTLLLLLALAGSAMTACGSDEPSTPRPYGYSRMELPQHVYDSFQCDGCPFTFEYPAYGEPVFVSKDSCQFDIAFRDYNLWWHFTLEWLREDELSYEVASEKYRGMVYTHSQKGKVYEEALTAPDGVGKYYELYGEVPTPATIYFSDTSDWAVEMALYLPTALKNDSLAPMIDHMKAEMQHAIDTWRFTGSQQTFQPGTNEGCPYDTSAIFYQKHPDMKPPSAEEAIRETQKPDLP